MAILARQRRTITLAGAQPYRHACNPALWVKVDLVRELEPALFLGLVTQRDPQRFFLPQLGEDCRLEFGMPLAEIAGISKRGIGQPRIERSVAICTELLAGGFHARGAFVFGVASGAGTRPFLAKHACNRPLKAFAQSVRSAPIGQPGCGGVIPDLGMAGQASLVAHRYEGIDVASLAIVLQAVVRPAECAGTPAGVEYNLARALGVRFDPLAGQMRYCRDCQKRQQDGCHKRP